MTNEEAVVILKNAIKKPNTEDGYLGQALTMAIKTLESQKWIPVSEPPKETGEYIVTIRWRNHYHYGDYKYSVVKRKYYADVKTWDDSLVIAYMPKPLPEPFREESDKNDDRVHT